MRKLRFDSKIPFVISALRRSGAGTAQRPFALGMTSLPIVLLLLSLAAPVVRAQGEASISGKVTDASGSAIPHCQHQDYQHGEGLGAHDGN